MTVHPLQPILQHASRRKLPLLLLWLIGMGFFAEAGVALRLYYREIPGGHVSDLTSHASFPDQPTSAEPVTESLERAVESGENFGSWTRGYLQAPQTGIYIFMISSDDGSEFWLSSSHSPADRRKIAENTQWGNLRDFNAHENQHSAPISLVKGEHYYFELFHKDHVGGDHVSVAWQLPDGTSEIPIPASRLLPFPVDTSYRAAEKEPSILMTYFGQPVAAMTNVSVVEGSSVTFNVTVEATPPVTFQWFRNRQPIPHANLSSYTVAKVKPADDVDLYSVVVSNRLGKAEAEAVLSVFADTTAPTVASALNLGDSRSSVIFFSKAVDPVTACETNNYLVDGVPPETATATSNPRAILLKTSVLARNELHFLKVRNVKDQASPPNAMLPDSFEIEAGLKVWLKFDDLNSTNAADASGNDRNAVLFGGPVPVASGKVGPGLAFDGKSDYAKLPEGLDDFTGGLTVAFWAKPTSVRSWATFIEFGNGAGKDSIILRRHQSSDDLFFQVYNNESIGSQTFVPKAIDLNQWQHLAVAMDAAGRVAIYKNGVLIREGVSALPRVLPRTDNFIGHSSRSEDEKYEGVLDEIRLYDRSLRAEEIKVLAGEIPVSK